MNGEWMQIAAEMGIGATTLRTRIAGAPLERDHAHAWLAQAHFTRSIG